MVASRVTRKIVLKTKLNSQGLNCGKIVGVGVIFWPFKIPMSISVCVAVENVRSNNSNKN